MLQRYSVLGSLGRRWYSPKVMVQMDDALHKQLENEEVNPKKHPGILPVRNTQVPQWVQNGMNIAIGDYRLSQLRIGADKLVTYLHGRRPPPEQEDVRTKMKEVEEMILKKMKHDEADPEALKEFLVNNRPKAVKMLKERLYPWVAINYDTTKSLHYMLARAAQDYAVLCYIFNEIRTNDREFRPKSLFDFGSGIGSVTWAASQFWLESLFEYYCVDCSASMNTIAETILSKKPSTLRNVYFRQFLPASHQLTYDIVVSAYSLFELPNANARMDVLLNLWSKTIKYLVIVEHGTRSGFRIVNEARDFILNLSAMEMENKSAEPAHVVAPCPHDLSCPRFLEDDTPCNFEALYSSLPIAQNTVVAKERFSYVVLRKGKRSEDDPQWPRLVRPAMIRKKHVICRMCSSSGNLQEIIFTAAKHGKFPYRCAKYSKWGDKLPIRIIESSNDESGELPTETNESGENPTESTDQLSPLNVKSSSGENEK